MEDYVVFLFSPFYFRCLSLTLCSINFGRAAQCVDENDIAGHVILAGTKRHWKAPWHGQKRETYASCAQRPTAAAVPSMGSF